MLRPGFFFSNFACKQRMDLIVMSDCFSNVLLEEIHGTREKRTIEVKFLLLFAEIRHVSLWQTFRNGV